MKISFEPLSASISPQGYKILSGIATIPLIVLAEANTHRSESRNWTSNRAMPTKEALKMTGFRPLHLGKAQRGMQAQEEEVDQQHLHAILEDWAYLEGRAMDMAQDHTGMGLAKQISNRLIVPFMWARGVMTSTSQSPHAWPFENLLALRAKSDKVEPHMHEFSWCIADAINEMNTQKGWAALEPGEWHLPFIKDNEESGNDDINWKDKALASAMRCARSSYNKLDGGKGTIEEDAKDAREKLLAGVDLHGSPFEHQARCIGITHVTQSVVTRTATGLNTTTSFPPFRSGNLVGWEQFRHVLAADPEMTELKQGTFTDSDYQQGRKRILRNLND